jgi:hypothetical protein
MKNLIVLLLLSNNAYATGWYCQSVASEWVEEGKTLRACGIGKGGDENTARQDASNNARKEFDLVCNKDTLCANKAINIDPQRSECTEDDEGFTCHRMFNYHITNEERKREAVIVTPAVRYNEDDEPAVVEKKIEVRHFRNVTNNNTNYITVQPVIQTIVKSNSVKGKDSYRTFIRSVNGVTIYSTNSRQYQGVYLTNPSDSEIERATKRGGLNAVYLYNP